MELRPLLNVAFHALTEGMDSDSVAAWLATSEPKAGQPGAVAVHHAEPQNRNVAALMSVSKNMKRR